MVRRNQLSEAELLALLEKLQIARKKPFVKVLFQNGHEMEGGITYQDRTGNGRIINLADEKAIDYNIHELADIIMID